MANAFGLKPMEFSAYINSQTNNLSKNYEAFSIRILKLNMIQYANKSNLLVGNGKTLMYMEWKFRP